MTSALLLTDVALAAVIIMLVLALNGIRVRIRLRRQREAKLRPGMSRAVARYATVGGDLPQPAGRAEREMLRESAMQALFDLRGSARDQVVTLLEQLGYLREAAAALRSRRRAVRRKAAEMLAVVAAPAVAAAVHAGLRDRDALVRTSCARTLARIGPAAIVGEVSAVAERDIRSVPGSAAAVVLALASSHPAALVMMLQPARPAELRLVAATVAGRLRLSALAPALRACLRDSDDALVAAAAHGLGLIGYREAVPELRALARTPGRSAALRAAAGAALGAIGDTGSVPVLEPLLLDTEWPVRAAAAQALAHLREPGTEALRRAALWGPPEASEQAEGVLGE